MKNIKIVILLIFVSLNVTGQEKSFSFFDELTGTIRVETEELDALSNTIVKTQHRSDDIVWARVVYRIIDLREKQNQRLYFPVRPDHPGYRNLFKLILDAICDNGVTAYERGRELTPRYEKPLNAEDLHANTILPKDRESDLNAYLIDADALGKPTLNEENFSEYTKDVLKFVIQEVVFFNKHTSRMYTKIIGIAPLYSAHPDKVSAGKSSMQSLQFSILFWVLFDEIQPYLAKQYIVPRKNEVQRLTFEEFFLQKMYSTYLLGDNNLYSRMLLDYDRLLDKEKFENYVRKEQKRIEAELINFEQDLWEY